jgi:hypothetical protein
LAPYDFHLFGPLKSHLDGKRFADGRSGWNGGEEVAESSMLRV